MNEKTKLMLQSYASNLLGVTLGLVVAVMTAEGVASPISFDTGDWLAVANGVWAAAIPTIIRWLDGRDPAFGRIADAVAKEVSKKIDEAAKAAKKSTTKTTTTAKKTTSTAKTTKAAPKK